MAFAVGPAFAQSTRPAPPPLPLDQRLPPSMNTPQPDLYRATPDTYAPRYDRTTPAPPPGGSVIYGPWGPYPQWAQPGQPVVVNPTVVVNIPPAESRTPEPPKPAVVAPRAQPKTFYVIPGCYAGDRRPERARLPHGCDLSKLRTVPPQVNRVSREP